MSKSLIFVCAFVVVLSAIHFGEAGRRHHTAKSTPNLMANFNRHIGTYFAQKIVMQKLKGGAICNECKEVVTELYSEIGQPQVQMDVQTFVENYVCPSLGTYKQLCVDFVETELPTVFKELEAALANAQAFCAEIELCPKSSALMKNRSFSKSTNGGKVRHPHFNANAINLELDEDEEEMLL